MECCSSPGVAAACSLRDRARSIALNKHPTLEHKLNVLNPRYPCGQGYAASHHPARVLDDLQHLFQCWVKTFCGHSVDPKPTGTYASAHQPTPVPAAARQQDNPFVSSCRFWFRAQTEKNRHQTYRPSQLRA